MKKQTSKKIKKGLSLFLAVLMVLSAWAWVAPEKAEAASTRGVPAINGSNYAGSTAAYGTPLFDGDLDRWFKFHNNNGSNSDYVQIYYPSQIYLDKSETLQSAGYYFNVDWRFGYSTDYRILIGANALGDNSQWSGEVTSWPNYTTMTTAFKNYGFDASLPEYCPTDYVYGKNNPDSTSYDLRIVGYGHSSQGTDGFNYPDENNNKFRHDKYVLFRSHGVNDPNKATIYLMGEPYGTYSGIYSTSGHSFKSYGVQQNYTSKNGWGNNKNSMFLQKGYGNGDTSSSNYNPGGWPEMEWNVTIYDKSALNSLVSTANGYSNADGRYTTATWNEFVSKRSAAQNVLTSREITQSDIDTAKNNLSSAIPKLAYSNFTITWLRHDGTTVAKTASYQWGTSVDCSSLSPAVSAPTPITGNDSLHQCYQWNPNNFVEKVTGNVTINEITSGTASHAFSGDPVYKDATSHTSTCAECGYIKTNAHTSNGGVVTTPAGCTTPGEKTFTCVYCKTAYATEEVAANGHKFNSGIFAEKEAGENGTHYQKCANCDVYGLGVTADACEKHTWVEDSRENAECEKNGYINYKCSVCKSTSYTKVLTMSGHLNVYKIDAKDVSKVCGGKGNVEYWYCKDCNKAWTDEAKTQEISNADANGNGIADAAETTGPAHVFDGSYVSASAGENGTHYRLCSICGTAKGLNGVENATESHDWNDGVETDKATCEKTGAMKYTCELCPQTYTVTTEKVNHKMTKHEAVKAECNKEGSIEYYTCEYCKKNYSDEAGTTVVTNTVVPALRHKSTEYHEGDEPIKAATCQSPAVYQGTCDYCGAVMIGATHEFGGVDAVNGHNFTDTKDIKDNKDGTHSYGCLVEGCGEYGPATDCNYKVIDETDSTCKTKGYVVNTCQTCGFSTTTYKELDYTVHEGETEIRDYKAATCNTNGYTGDTYCLGCDNKIEEGKAITADPAKHPHEDMREYDAKASTCQTAGHTAYTYCSACDTYAVNKTPIATKPHTYTAYSSIGNGEHIAYCDTCDEAVAAKAEDKGTCAGGTATCEAPATCSVCNTEYGTTNENNHTGTAELVNAEAATCQKPGYSGDVVYSCCGAVKQSGKDIDQLKHTFGSWTSNGDGTHTRVCTTCTEEPKAFENGTCDGVATCEAAAMCSICKTAYGEKDTDNHTKGTKTVNAKEASCTEEGYTGDIVYICCGAVKTQGKVIETKPHSYTVEVSKVLATCIADGKIVNKCATCTDTDETVLVKNPNNHASAETKVVGNKAATCTEDGYTGDVYYVCCYDENKTPEENKTALKSKGNVVTIGGAHDYSAVVPEYMLEKDADGKAIIVETKDEEGNVIARALKLKSAEPDYDAKAEARHDDDKWYHAQVCNRCGEVEYTACYTFNHTYNCKDTDICAVCSGLCSLKDDTKHASLVVANEADVKAATCIETGIKAYYKCSDCGKEFLDSAGKTELDKTDENADGVIDVLVAAKVAHSVDWSAGEKKDGFTRYYCSNKANGCTYYVDVEDAPSACVHVWSDEDADATNDYKVVKEPTCFSTGYKALYCTVCGVAKSGSNLVLGLKEHTYAEGEVTVEATCDTDGIMTYYCTFVVADEEIGDSMLKCGHYYEEVIPATGHEWDDGVVVEGKEADCSKSGEKLYTCGVCGDTKTEVVPKTGEHQTSSEGVVIRPATCNKEGIIQYSCNVCGSGYIEAIPATGEHNLVTIPGVESTCNTPGYSESVICDDCGAIIKEAEEYGVAVDAHHDHDGDGYCDECTYDMMEGACNCICHKQHGLMKFIYKIINFFWKLFGIGKGCRCGAEHY